MIEAKTQAEYLSGYQRAYRAAVTEMGSWHTAWREYHAYATRRRDGQPLKPTSDISTSTPGAAAGHTLSEHDQLAVNHIQVILRTIVASTLNRDPEFSVVPEFEGFAAPGRAKLAACALNTTWRKRKFNDPIRDAYWDSLEYGRGWIQLGWQSSFTRPVSGDTAGAQMEDAVKAISEVSRRGARLGHKSFTPDELLTQLKSFEGRLLVEDYPTVVRVSPFDMFFDPMATTPDEARWIAKRWRCPTAFAKSNEDWKPKARNAIGVTPGLEATLDPVADSMASAGTAEYEGNDNVWIIDFFDLGDGTWCQFTESGDDFLRKPEPIPYPFGQPFVWVENIDDNGEVVPIGEVEGLWPLQRALSSIATELGTDRIQSRGKILVREEAAEQLEAAFRSSDQGLVVSVASPSSDGSIDQAYKFVQAESRASELTGQSGLVAQWMTQQSGISDYLRGGGVSGQTATAVNAMQLASANFMGEKAERVRNFIEATAQRVLQMIQVFSRLDYHVTTKGENPDTGQVEDVTLAYGRSHMAGGFRIIVSADSTETKSPQARQAKAQAIVSTSLPFVQLGVVDPAKLYKYAMTEGFDMVDPTEIMTQQAYTGPPPPAPVADTAQGGPAGAATTAIPGLGVSMTPGSGAGQLGASAAMDRTMNGDVVPTNHQ